MQNSVYITDEILEEAIRGVEQDIIVPHAAGLNSILSGDLLGRVSVAWESFTNALHDTFVHGKHYAEDNINGIIISVNELLKAAGEKARDIHNEFKKRLQGLVSKIINAAFQFMPQSLTIGEKSYPISKLSYTQKISLGGSLKANFLEVAELTAHGEIEIQVEYSVEATPFAQPVN